MKADTLEKLEVPGKLLEARSGFEPLDKGFADLCLTTWLPRLNGWPLSLLYYSNRLHASVALAYRIRNIPSFKQQSIRMQIGERGEITSRRATAVVANLPRHIAQREVETVGKMLNWGPEALCVQESRDSAGPGNVVMIEIGSSEVIEIFSAFGQVALASGKSCYHRGS